MKRCMLAIALLLSVTVRAQHWKSLEDSLHAWAKTDQLAAGMPPIVGGSGSERMSWPDFQVFKDSVFAANYQHMSGVFEKYGYPGTDKISDEAVHAYWLIVQHLDKWPQFQSKVLEAMKPLVEKKLARGGDFAYLTDRVRINAGRPQLYGTQLEYDLNICQAKPKNLEDPAHVNERRKALGMESLEKYLNSLGDAHFMMNKAMYTAKGITGAKHYPVVE